MTTLKFRRTACWAGFVMATAAAVTLSAGELPESPTGSRVFETGAGGFRVAVPAAWHVKEIPGADLYQAFLSREKVEEKGDRYTYGLSVVRLRDYRKSFTLESKAAADVAQEYATRVAAQLAGGEGGTVVGLPTGDHGLKLTKYMVLGGKGPDCVSGTLLIGVSGKRWFHALWECPCSEGKEEERISEINAMVESLHVDSKWGEERK